MYKTFLAIALTAAAASCSNSPQEPAAAGEPDAASKVHAGADPVTGFAEGKPFVVAGCYEMTHKRDTATLSLHVQDTLVSGTLVYRWHAKDDNTGTIKGVLRDSLILADYTFRSEGLASVREVVLKIKDTTLVQAFGELEDKNGRVVFKNRSNLQYLDASPFIKTTCKE